VPVYLLSREVGFPPVEDAEDGLLAVGGELTPEWLTRAYSEGIFPWYSEGEPILWHSPDPRMVLTSTNLRVSRSLRRAMRAQPYRLTLDTCFHDVIDACAIAPRPDQDGTWITPEMGAAYCTMNDLGLAHSAEAWDGDELVGGLYGVSLGAAFFGESMFANRGDASKIAFVALVRQMERWGITLIDCQIHSDHLERFGAEEWSRERYLRALETALRRPTRQGPWSFDDDFDPTDP
jgi:leucyl/phenylalanyl-tRNA--protein transferase